MLRGPRGRAAFAVPAFLLLVPRPAVAAETGVVFATSVETPLQARKADLLVDSLRRFGGPYADAPVHVVVDVVTEQTAPLGKRPGVTAHPLAGDAEVRRFPYARKVLAAAQVERLVERSARTLVWLDPETLVLSPPTALVLRGEASLAVRPVFLRNAVALAEGVPLDAWWARIAREARLDPSFPETVAPLVDEGRVRWYVNCGVYSVRPSRGVLREWARAFSALARDPEVRKGAGPGGLRLVFLHQAVFGAVALAMVPPSERTSLPNAVGYPLHLHERVPAASRLARLDDAQVVIHESLFESRPGWRGVIPASEPLARFVDEGVASLLQAADAPRQADSAPPGPARQGGELQAAIAAKDWAGALPLAEAAVEAAEEAHVDALYALSRVEALLGRRQEALDTLRRAHEAGFVDAFTLRKDEAFAALKDDARFQAVAKAVWLKGYLWLLERKERDAYQKPDEVMRALAPRPGERVADVGAGSGYFTLRLARAVGSTGSVLAVDVNPDLLAFLESRVKEAGLSNVRTLVVGKDDPSLPPGGIDTVFMVDTLHYLEDRVAWLRKVRSGLAPGGRVVVIDFVPKSVEERPWGPPPSQRMSREEVDEAMAAVGLAPVKVHAFLPEQFFVEYAVR